MWSPSSWVGCSRLSLCITLLIVESGAQDHRRATLGMMMFRIGTAHPSGTSRRRSIMSWVHKDESQCFPPTWHASVDVWSLDIWCRIRGNASQRDQSHMNTRHRVFRLVWALTWSKSPTSSIYVLCYWDWLFSLSFQIFSGCLRDVPWDFSDVFNVDISSLFIVGESPHRV
jgi:hypothetical protein